MSLHVILGKGQVGTTLAEMLAARGEQVRVLSRSGGHSADGVTHVKVDASDAAALREHTKGATVLYNCANPAGYHQWVAEWPPLAKAVLDAAEAAGAVLVMTGNLYMYGPGHEHMTEETPLAAPGVKGRVRIQMWRDALARHETGRVRVVEARASDYFGPRALADALFGERVVPNVLGGKPVRLLGDVDAPRTFTYIPDVARTLIRLGAEEKAWGRAWHVPSPAPITQRGLYEAFCRVAGVPPRTVGRLPWWLLIGVVGAFQPAMRGFSETRYQWDRPFVMDSSAFTEAFGESATDLDTALKHTLDWWRAREV